MSDIEVVEGSTLDEEMTELESRFSAFIQNKFGQSVHFYGNFEINSESFEAIKATMAWHKEEESLFFDKAYFPANCKEAGDNYIALYGKGFKVLHEFWKTYYFYLEE